MIDTEHKHIKLNKLQARALRTLALCSATACNISPILRGAYIQYKPTCAPWLSGAGCDDGCCSSLLVHTHTDT